VSDPDSAAFWDGLSVGEVRLQRCRSCGRVQFPPLPGCPLCGSEDAERLIASGRGQVYACITVRQPIGSLTAADVPCTFATVELAEGPTMVGRLVGTEAPAIGLPVQARIWRRGGGTELGFVAYE